MSVSEFIDKWKSYTKANNRNWKGLYLSLTYLIAHFIVNTKKTLWIIWLILIPYLVLYRIFNEWILGVEIPARCKIGKGLIIDHGQALVLNKNVIIGDNCRLRNSITIGNKQFKNGEWSNCPRIGSNVDIGANTVIIGDIIIGDNVKIGAGSVVVKDVPNNCVIVGNPAKEVKPINGL